MPTQVAQFPKSPNSPRPRVRLYTGTALALVTVCGGFVLVAAHALPVIPQKKALQQLSVPIGQPILVVVQTTPATAAPAQTAPAGSGQPAAPATANPANVPGMLPVNNQPTDAAVDWDSRKLRIAASNSSLVQILRDISAKTGASLRGVEDDQRVFGVYGPGTARDVISQLLDGSGYNVMILGDQGHGAPRQIILSARPKGGVPPTPSMNQNEPSDDNAAENNDQQPLDAAPPAPPAFTNPPTGIQPRNPQMIQDMQQQQRQLQMQQQQQQTQPPQQQTDQPLQN